MISKPLMKAAIKQNYIVFIIIFGVLMLYLPIIISMYNPKTQESLDEILTMLPQQLISAMGFTGDMGSLLTFIATYFYGFLILLLPMIYTITVANRSIASHVDRGSMAYLLSTPNTRRRIAGTQGCFLLISTTLLLSFITLAGILICELLFPGDLDIKGFLLLNLGALLLYFALTGISFFASCAFNDAKNSLALGAGLPVAFLLLQMISDIGEKFNFLKYFSLYTLFDQSSITSGGNYLPSFLLLSIIGIVLYSAGIASFRRRDLPL